MSRRNFAELGIGTNPFTKKPDSVLEAEKIRETVHVTVEDSSHIGGTVNTDLHQDFVLPKPNLNFDGKPIIKNGEIVI